MISGKRHILSTLLIIALFPDFSPAEENLREMLMYEKIPVVSVSAKHPMNISDSPSATYLITEEDIRHSGATNIPDLLRMVPGIDVMAVSASDFNVSARGNNQLLSNKILVLIDGRFVYQDMFGMVFWETLTVQLEDIRQIEIVLGPGSALYGANAFNGVINIVTKDPYEDPGTVISVRNGNPPLSLNGITHRGRTGNFSYKVSASDNKIDKWEESNIASKQFYPHDRSEDIQKFRGLLQYHPTMDSAISISGGKSSGTIEFFPLEYLAVIPWSSEISWYRAMYKDPRLMIHYFENYGNQEIYGSTDDKLSYRTGEGEITYTFSAGSKNIITAGATTRKNMIDMRRTGVFYSEPWGIYLQDDLKLSDKLMFIGGARYDYYPLAGYQTSPRGSLVYHLTEENTLRLSAGKAYRNPSFFESYLDYWEILAKDPSPEIHNIWFILNGSRNLEPEEIVSYETGFQYRNGSSHYGINLYYNDIKNIIGHRYKTSASCEGGDYPVNICIGKEFINTYSAYSYGGEASVENRLTKTLSARTGYAYLEMFNKETGKRIESSPLHNLSGEFRYKSPSGLAVNLHGLYHGKTVWNVESFSVDPQTLNLTSGSETFEVPEYTIFNLNLAWKLNDNMEISLAGSNIFNHRHREFPDISMPVDSNNPLGVLASVADSRPNAIGSRWTASLRIDF